MNFDRTFLFVFNLLARLFGVLAILVGVCFLVSAYALKDNRPGSIGIGIFLIVMGAAFLLTISVSANQLARIRRLRGRSE
jgi:uncharacterized membrane protein